MFNEKECFTDHNQLPRLLTARDVANILNIGQSTAYQLMNRDELPSIRIGRSVRVRPEDLEKFIEEKGEKVSNE